MTAKKIAPKSKKSALKPKKAPSEPSVAHYDVGALAPRAAHGLDVDALVAARRLPPCEVRA